MVIQENTKRNGNGFKNSLMTLEYSISDQSYIVEIISRLTTQSSVLTVRRIYKSFVEMSASNTKDSRQNLSGHVKPVFS